VFISIYVQISSTNIPNVRQKNSTVDDAGSAFDFVAEARASGVLGMLWKVARKSITHVEKVPHKFLFSY